MSKAEFKKSIEKLILFIKTINNPKKAFFRQMYKKYVTLLKI
jgi:hypothetical protein